jgi:hypothetical protein
MIKRFMLFAMICCALPTFAQNWPKPSTAPDTPTRCVSPASAPGLCGGQATALVSSYSLPLGFIGRMLDSTGVRELQPGFRTARARTTALVPLRDRLYEIVGSALFAYTLSTLPQRLASGEALVPVTMFGAQMRAVPETVLMPAAFFYAEHEPNWSIDLTDGQDRLYGLDADDRGYVYVAYQQYGWGALHDSGSALTSVHQELPRNGVEPPYRVLSVQSAGSYYLIASSNVGSSSNVFYVGTSSAFAVERRADINVVFGGFAKARDGRIAAACADGHLRFYTSDGIVTGSAALDIAPTAGPFYSIDSDGTNFYATSQSGLGSGEPANAKLSIFTFAGGTYNRTDIDLGRPYGDQPNVRYGTGGYVLVFGTEGFRPNGSGDSSFSRNLRLYKLSGTSIAAVPLLVGASMQGGLTREYFANAYHVTRFPGFVAPDMSGFGASNPPVDARVFETGGVAYLLASVGSLEDLYRLGTAAPPQPPQPCPTLTPPPAPHVGCLWVLDTSGTCPVYKESCTTPQPPTPQPGADLSAVRTALASAASAIQAAVAALDGVTPPVVQPPVVQPPVVQPPIVQPPPTPTPQPQPPNAAGCIQTAGSPPHPDGCQCLVVTPDGIAHWVKRSQGGFGPYTMEGCQQ